MCNLGETQKKWLKKEIESSEARYTIVASGVEILPDDRFNEHFYESTREFLITLRNPKTSKKNP
jgi:phosphodiesterase/alkaline phosphatase D-like protein